MIFELIRYILQRPDVNGTSDGIQELPARKLPTVNLEASEVELRTRNPGHVTRPEVEAPGPVF